MSEPMSLPSHVARCNGYLATFGGYMNCPLRFHCKRFLARPTTVPEQGLVWIAPELNPATTCDDFMHEDDEQ